MKNYYFFFMFFFFTINFYAQTKPNQRVKQSVEKLEIIDKKLSEELELFPNPIIDKLFIRSNIALKKVEIFSLLGQKEIEFYDNLNTIYLDNLVSGIYIIKIYSDKGIAVRKLLKR